MSNKPPIEVPQGAIRLNTDSQKLEFFAQDRWYEMATHTNIFDGSAGRALIFRGSTSSQDIDVINIDTAGNATDFGATHHNNSSVGASGDRTRALCYGGGPGSATNTIEFFTISIGNAATDFGDLTFTGRQVGNACNSTRTLMCGGYPSPFGTGDAVNNICYVTTQTTGNAVDFGDTNAKVADSQSTSNSLRGIWAGGLNPSLVNTIDYVTISTLGNASDFGDLPTVQGEGGGCSDSHGGLSSI